VNSPDPWLPRAAEGEDEFIPMGGIVKVLALDLSKSRTGWACWERGWQFAKFGSWQLGSEYSSDGMVFARVHERLSEHHQVFGFDRVYFEEAINPANLGGHTNIGTLKLLSGIAAHAESFCYAYGIPVCAVNVARWRKDFLSADLVRDTKAKAKALRNAGQSKAGATGELKSLTIERCRQLGMNPRFSDEADAIGLLDYALDFHEHVTPPWRSAEVLRPPLGAAQ
jgi:hypothetical protein